MSRRVGLASLVVLVLAFAGAAAGPASPRASLRLVVSVSWLSAPEEVEREVRPDPPPVPQPAASTVARATQSLSLRALPVERWLFQRPPPIAV